MVMERWTIKVLDEVRDWAAGLSDEHRQKFAHHVDLLAEMGELLPFPYSSGLGGKLRELRFNLGREARRVTYYAASGRRFVLLTTFRKTKQKEDREVERARRAIEAHVAAEKEEGR
jgi:hypothetical protein